MEFMRAGGQMRGHDMADLSEDQARHFMMDEKRMQEFKLRHEREFDEQRREMELQRHAMEDNMRRSQEDMRRSAEDMNRERIRHQDMKREMEHFYMMRNDSVMHLRHLQSDMDAYPPAPVPPPAPPADINTPARPGIENPVAPESPENLDQPEPDTPSELLNNDQGTEDKDNAAPLDSKLKELEKE